MIAKMQKYIQFEYFKRFKDLLQNNQTCNKIYYDEVWLNERPYNMPLLLQEIFNFFLPTQDAGMITYACYVFLLTVDKCWNTACGI